MLPSYVNLIFLSATTPNTLEFSDWIGRTKRKSVNVIKTDYRPVPLSHHLWAGLKLNKIMEGKSGFLDKGYKEATNALLPKSAQDKKAADKKGGVTKGKTVTPAPRGGPKNLAWQAMGNKNNWMSLVRFLEREELTPTVIFSFSKKVRTRPKFQSLSPNAANQSSSTSFSLCCFLEMRGNCRYASIA
jgi:antiviral helicase SKI2